jgi:hypothetical protein
MRLGVPENLERVLSSTNPIEKTIQPNARYRTPRQTLAEAARWCAVGALTRMKYSIRRSHRAIDATRKAASLNYVAAAQYQQRIAHHWP